jgi:DNA repair exonuclease SbcCD ATPase subunit
LSGIEKKPSILPNLAQSGESNLVKPPLQHQSTKQLEEQLENLKNELKDKLALERLNTISQIKEKLDRELNPLVKQEPQEMESKTENQTIEDVISQIKKDRDNLEKKLKKVKKDNKKKDEELDNLKQILSTPNADEKLNLANDLALKKEEEIRKLKDEIEKLPEIQEKLEKARKEIANLKNTIAGAQAQKDIEAAKKDQEIDQLKKVLGTNAPSQKAEELQRLLTQKDQEIANLKNTIAGAQAQKDIEAAKKDQEIDQLKKVLGTNAPSQKAEELQRLLTQKDQEIANLKNTIAGAQAQKDIEAAKKDQEIDQLKKVLGTNAPSQKAEELQRLLTQKDQEIANLKNTIAGAQAQKDIEAAKKDQEIDQLKKVLGTNAPSQKAEELQRLLTQKDQEIANLKNTIAGAQAQKDIEAAKKDQEIDQLKKVLGTNAPSQKAEELQRLLTQKDQEIANLKNTIAGAQAQKDIEAAKKDQEIDQLKKVLGTNAPSQKAEELQRLLTQKDQEIANLKNTIAGAQAQKDIEAAKKEHPSVQIPSPTFNESNRQTLNDLSSALGIPIDNQVDSRHSSPKILTPKPLEPRAAESLLEKVNKLMNDLTRATIEKDNAVNKLSESDSQKRLLENAGDALRVKNLELLKTVEELRSKLGLPKLTPEEITTLKGPDVPMKEIKQLDQKTLQPALIERQQTNLPASGLVSGKDGKKTEPEVVSRYVSHPATEDSSPQVNELMEDIKKLQKAKDRLQGIVDNILTEETDKHTPKMLPRIDEETMKIIQDHAKVRPHSEEGSESPQKIQERPSKPSQDDYNDSDLDQLEQKVNERINIVNNLEERLGELKKENDELKRKINLLPEEMLRKIEKEEAKLKRKSEELNNPYNKRSSILSQDDKDSEEPEEDLFNTLNPQQQEQITSLPDEAAQIVLESLPLIALAGKDELKSDLIDKLIQVNGLINERERLEDENAYYAQNLDLKNEELAKKDEQMAKLQDELEKAKKFGNAVPPSMQSIVAELEEQKQKNEDLLEDNQNMIDALEDIRQRIADGRIIVKDEEGEEEETSQPIRQSPAETNLSKDKSDKPGQGKAIAPQKQTEPGTGEKTAEIASKDKDLGKGKNKQPPSDKQKVPQTKQPIEPSPKPKTQDKALKDKPKDDKAKTKKEGADKNDKPTNSEEVEELLRVATEELSALQEKFDDLSAQTQDKDQALTQLKLDNKILLKELDQFKTNAMIKDQKDEIEQLKAIEGQVLDDTKGIDDLTGENSELVDFLKKAIGDTKDLRDQYTDAVQKLEDKINDMREKEISSPEFIKALEEELKNAPVRDFEQLKQFNHGLWDAVVDQKKIMNNLAKRLQTLDRWADDKVPGQPKTDRDIEENMTLPQEKIPELIKSIEAASATKKPATTTQEIATATSPKQPKEQVDEEAPQAPEDQMSNEVLVDLLLSIVGLTEEVRQAAFDNAITETDRIQMIQEKLDNFEILGANGKLDFNNIQKLIQSNKDAGNDAKIDQPEIKEVSPEEEEDQDSRRPGSSKRPSKSNSVRQKSDSARKIGDSKEGSSETEGDKISNKKNIEKEELIKKLEEAFKDLDKKDREMANKDDEIAELTNQLESALEQLEAINVKGDTKKPGQPKPADKKTPSSIKASKDEATASKAKDDEIKRQKTEMEGLRKQLEEAQKKLDKQGQADTVPGDKDKKQTKVAGEKGKPDTQKGVEERLKDKDAEIARLTEALHAQKTADKASSEKPAAKSTDAPEWKKRAEELSRDNQKKDAEIARLVEALAGQKETEAAAKKIGKSPERTLKPGEKPAKGEKEKTGDKTQIPESEVPEWKKRMEDLAKDNQKKDAEIARLIDQLSGEKEEEMAERPAGEKEGKKRPDEKPTDKTGRPELPGAVPEQKGVVPELKKRVDDLVKDNQKKDAEIARLVDSLSGLKSTESAGKGAGVGSLSPTMQDILKDKDAEIARLTQALKAKPDNQTITAEKSQEEEAQSPDAQEALQMLEEAAQRLEEAENELAEKNDEIANKDNEIAQLTDQLVNALEQLDAINVKGDTKKPGQQKPADKKTPSSIKASKEEATASKAKDDEIKRQKTEMEGLRKQLEEAQKKLDKQGQADTVPGDKDKKQTKVPGEKGKPDTQKGVEERLKDKDAEIARLTEALHAQKTADKASSEKPAAKFTDAPEWKKRAEELSRDNQKKDAEIARLVEALAGQKETEAAAKKIGKSPERTLKPGEKPAKGEKEKTGDKTQIPESEVPEWKKRMEDLAKDNQKKDAEIARLIDQLSGEKEEEMAERPAGEKEGKKRPDEKPTDKTGRPELPGAVPEQKGVVPELKKRVDDLVKDNQKKDAEIARLVDSLSGLKSTETAGKGAGVGPLSPTMQDILKDKDAEIARLTEALKASKGSDTDEIKPSHKLYPILPENPELQQTINDLQDKLADKEAELAKSIAALNQLLHEDEGTFYLKLDSGGRDDVVIDKPDWKEKAEELEKKLKDKDVELNKMIEGLKASQERDKLDLLKPTKTSAPESRRSSQNPEWESQIEEMEKKLKERKADMAKMIDALSATKNIEYASTKAKPLQAKPSNSPEWKKMAEELEKGIKKKDEGIAKALDELEGLKTEDAADKKKKPSGKDADTDAPEWKKRFEDVERKLEKKDADLAKALEALEGYKAAEEALKKAKKGGEWPSEVPELKKLLDQAEKELKKKDAELGKALDALEGYKDVEEALKKDKKGKWPTDVPSLQKKLDDAEKLLKKKDADLAKALDELEGLKTEDAADKKKKPSGKDADTDAPEWKKRFEDVERKLEKKDADLAKALEALEGYKAAEEALKKAKKGGEWPSEVPELKKLLDQAEKELKKKDAELGKALDALEGYKDVEEALKKDKKGKWPTDVPSLQKKLDDAEKLLKKKDADLAKALDELEGLKTEDAADKKKKPSGKDADTDAPEWKKRFEDVERKLEKKDADLAKALEALEGYKAAEEALKKAKKGGEWPSEVPELKKLLDQAEKELKKKDAELGKALDALEGYKDVEEALKKDKKGKWPTDVPSLQKKLDDAEKLLKKKDADLAKALDELEGLKTEDAADKKKKPSGKDADTDAPEWKKRFEDVERKLEKKDADLAKALEALEGYKAAEEALKKAKKGGEWPSEVPELKKLLDQAEKELKKKDAELGKALDALEGYKDVEEALKKDKKGKWPTDVPSLQKKLDDAEKLLKKKDADLAKALDELEGLKTEDAADKKKKPSGKDADTDAPEWKKRFEDVERKLEKKDADLAKALEALEGYKAAEEALKKAKKGGEWPSEVPELKKLLDQAEKELKKKDAELGKALDALEGYKDVEEALKKDKKGKWPTDVPSLQKKLDDAEKLLKKKDADLAKALDELEGLKTEDAADKKKKPSGKDADTDAPEWKKRFEDVERKLEKKDADLAKALEALEGYKAAEEALKKAKKGGEWPSEVPELKKLLDQAEKELKKKDAELGKALDALEGYKDVEEALKKDKKGKWPTDVPSLQKKLDDAEKLLKKKDADLAKALDELEGLKTEDAADKKKKPSGKDADTDAPEWKKRFEDVERKLEKKDADLAKALEALEGYKAAEEALKKAKKGGEWPSEVPELKKLLDQAEKELKKKDAELGKALDALEGYKDVEEALKKDKKGKWPTDVPSLQKKLDDAEKLLKKKDADLAKALDELEGLKTEDAADKKKKPSGKDADTDAPEWKKRFEDVERKLEKKDADLAKALEALEGYKAAEEALKKAKKGGEWPSEVPELKKLLDQAEKELKKKDAELGKALDALEGYKDVEEALKKDKKGKWPTDVPSLQKKLDDAEKLLKKKDADLAKALDELEGLKTEDAADKKKKPSGKDADTDAPEWKKRFEDVERKLEKKDADLAKALEALEGYKAAEEALKKAKKGGEWPSEVPELKKLLDQAEKELKKKDAELGKALDALEGYKDSVVASKSVDKKKPSGKDADTDAPEWKKRFEDVERKLEKKDAELAKAIDELNGYKDQVAAFKKANKSPEIAELRRKAEDLEKKLDKKDAELRKALDSVDALKEIEETYKKKLQADKKKPSGKDADTDAPEWKKRFEDVERKLEKKDADLAKALEALEGYKKADKAHLKKPANRITEAEARSAGIPPEVLDKLNEAAQIIDDQRAEIAKLENEVENAFKELENCSKAIPSKSRGNVDKPQDAKKQVDGYVKEKELEVNLYLSLGSKVEGSIERSLQAA